MHRHGHIDAITHVPLADAVMAIETARTRCRYVGRSEYDDYGPQTDESTRGGHHQQVVANGAAVQVT